MTESHGSSNAPQVGAPQVGIGIVILSEKSEVLLIRRGKPPKYGEWSIPGGRQKFGETVAECARREAREETGLDVTIVGLLDVVDGIMRGPDGDIEFHYTLVDFLGRASGEPVAGDDALLACWVTPSALADYNLWSETRRVIDLALERVLTCRESE